MNDQRKVSRKCIWWELSYLLWTDGRTETERRTWQS